MRDRFYKKLLQYIVFYLMVRGAEKINKNRYCTIYRYNFDDDIILPNKMLDEDIVQIIFCRDKKIDAVFTVQTQYYREAFKKFITFIKKRQKQLLARSLNEASF